ncbi:MAG: ribonuclease HII [Elusimicrobiales bacterium]|nr:ribonuclease HII [Elusimicrobiales bacterium]
MYHINLDLDLKKKFKKSCIIGVDEAGRGPLAGPVVAVACIIKDYTNYNIQNIKDSKKLTYNQREEIYKSLLLSGNIIFSFGYSTNKEIDIYNIFKATLLAMRRAVERIVKFNSLSVDDVLVVVDGNKKIDNLNLYQISLIKGDDKSAVVGCASIFAKILRDRWMSYYDKIYPDYGFAKHKGYPTKHHIEMIKRYGLSPLHRYSFRPCVVRTKI